MKKVLMVWVWAAVVWAALFGAGCATFNQNAYKAMASTEATVDSAMRSWGAYVVWARGTATVDQVKLKAQEDYVRQAYEVYRATMNGAYDARRTYALNKDETALKQALALMADAGALVAKLVMQFSVKP